MKKLLCVILCLVTLCSLFAGCKAKKEEMPEGSMNFLGLFKAGVTAEELAEAVGVDASTVISTTLSSGEELLIVNDVLYNTILYKQLQCINYGDKTVITLTYIPSDEEFDDVVNGILMSLDDEFGAPGSISMTGEGFNAYTWRNTEINDNYIFFYPLTEEEFKLSFYLY